MFEVGKKYKHTQDKTIIYECVFVENGWAVIKWIKNGESEYCAIKMQQLYQSYYVEYKEPVVHKRDVIWLQKRRNADISSPYVDHAIEISSICVPHGEVYKPGFWVEVKRQTVEYNEEF